MDAGIAVTLSIEVFKQRKILYDMVSKPFIERFNTDIVIVGTGNVGKTTFVNQLTAKLSDSRFTAPQGHSTNVEHAFVRVNRETRPKKLVTIPGQVGYESYVDGLQQHLLSPSTTGLIYMVDWGYRVPRREDLKLLLIADGIESIADLTKFYRNQEIEHFSDIISKSVFSEVNWIFILINKSDLYHEKIGDAIKYYQHSFSPIINRHLPSVHVEYIPMTSNSCGLSFNNINITSQMHPLYTQDKMIYDFMERLSTRYLNR